MQYRFYGYKRTTHKYNEAWKDLDDTEFVGKFDTLKFGVVKYDPNDEYGEYGRYVVRVKSHRNNISEHDMWSAMAYEFNHSCRCEHDCCGCSIHRVYKVKRDKRKEWLVFISATRNI